MHILAYGKRLTILRDSLWPPWPRWDWRASRLEWKWPSLSDKNTLAWTKRLIALRLWLCSWCTCCNAASTSFNTESTFRTTKPQAFSLSGSRASSTAGPMSILRPSRTEKLEASLLLVNVCIPAVGAVQAVGNKRRHVYKPAHDRASFRRSFACISCARGWTPKPTGSTGSSTVPSQLLLRDPYIPIKLPDSV